MDNKQVNLTREVTYKILIQIYEGKVFLIVHLTSKLLNIN